IKIQLDFASQANVSYETAQLFADIQRDLHRSGADVDIDGALLDGFGDLPRHPAANCADVDLRNDDADWAVISVAAFIVVCPYLHLLDQFRDPDDRIWILLIRDGARDIGGIDRDVIAEHGDLEEGLAGLYPNDAEIRALCDQREISHSPVRDGVPRTRFLRDVLRRLEFIDRLDSDLAHHCHQQQVAHERNAAVLYCLGGQQPCGHAPFVIHYSFS